MSASISTIDVLEIIGTLTKNELLTLLPANTFLAKDIRTWKALRAAVLRLPDESKELIYSGAMGKKGIRNDTKKKRRWQEEEEQEEGSENIVGTLTKKELLTLVPKDTFFSKELRMWKALKKAVAELSEESKEVIRLGAVAKRKADDVRQKKRRKEDEGNSMDGGIGTSMVDVQCYLN